MLSGGVCALCCGFIVGWVHKAFELSMSVVELTCVALGDAHCTILLADENSIERVRSGRVIQLLIVCLLGNQAASYGTRSLGARKPPADLPSHRRHVYLIRYLHASSHSFLFTQCIRHPRSRKAHLRIPPHIPTRD